MTVKLLYHTPLYACAHAIRMSHDNHDKSDSQRYDDLYSDQREWINCGPKDRALIERVGNKLKHASVLEHLSYTFDISDVSRALLQELARNRHGFTNRQIYALHSQRAQIRRTLYRIH